MVEPNGWLRCAQKVSELGLAGAGGPSADLLVDALRILLWLCAERAPVPHSVEMGPKKSVVFGWQQGEAVVELRAITPGQSVWRTANGTGQSSESDRLDATAAQVLRSLIPLADAPSELDGTSANSTTRRVRRKKRNN
jgi:hypothetical protein